MPNPAPALPAVVDRGVRQVAVRAIVAISAAELFARLADPRQHGAVDGSGTVGSNISGPKRLSPGATFTTSMKMFGLPYKTTASVTEYTEPTVIEWAMGGGHRWRWELRDLGDGTTEVTEVFDYTRSRGAKVLELLGIPRRNAQGMISTLRSLQRPRPTS